MIITDTQMLIKRKFTSSHSVLFAFLGTKNCQHIPYEGDHAETLVCRIQQPFTSYHLVLFGESLS